MPAFLKFGAREHMQQLVDEGLLHMKSLGHFVGLENDANRGDENEGLGALYQGSLITIQLGEHTLEDVVSATIRPADAKPVNVYCMYALKDDSIYVDPRNLAFGDTVVLIHKLGKFYERLQDALQHRRYKADFVEYVDPKLHHGELGPFKKFKNFDYQKEYRVVLLDGSTDAVDLRLGSLRDIAQLLDSKTINEQIRLTNHLLPPKRS